MRKLGYLTLLILVVAISGGCLAGSQQQTAASPTAAPTGKPSQAAKPGWEAKWDNLVAEGKKEGLVRLYAIWPPETMTALTNAMKDKFGISLEFTVLRGSEVVAKVQAEQRAGLNLVDVYGQGTSQLAVAMKEAGMLGKIGPMLILPDVLDAKVWRTGQVPYADKDQMVIPMTAYPQRYFLYNTSIIKPGELKTYKDVLDPKYKGKINMMDPTISGTGNALFAHLAYNLWNLEEAKDFLRRLIVEQDVFITRDYRLQAETVARGKYPIGLAVQGSSVADFLALGAPVAVPDMREVSISNQAGVLGVPNIIPHPNATAVFINWLLTQEGQTIFSKTSGTPVMRQDISQEWVNPAFRLKPDDKSYWDNEEALAFKETLYKVAKDVIDANTK